MNEALTSLAKFNLDISENTTNVIKRLIEIAYLEGQLHGIDQAKHLVADELGVKL